MDTMRCQQSCQECALRQECSGRIVCRCVQVTEDVIITAVTTLGVRTIKELKVVTGAGDGCMCCHRQLQEYLEQYAQSSSEPILSCR